MKTCPRCGETKPKAEFYKDRQTPDGLQRHCKCCHEIYKRQWRAANRERERQRNARYRADNPAAEREKCARWRTKNREQDLARKAKYRAMNPDVVMANNAHRRAAKRNATPGWLTESERSEFVAFYEAARAFRIYTGQEYHVDHIVPLRGLTVCGLHVPWNMQVLPGIENLRKQHNHWPDMWQ